MTDPDTAKPYHAKSTAPGQEAADVVAEVLAHAAEREKAATKKVVPKGPPKWMLPLTVNLGVLALYFLIAQPDFLVMNPNVEPRAIEERVAQTTVSMGMVVGRIDGYLAREGSLPESLVAANVPGADEFTYTLLGDSVFMLTAAVDSVTIVFDSQLDDRATFFAGMANRLGG